MTTQSTTADTYTTYTYSLTDARTHTTQGGYYVVALSEPAAKVEALRVAQALNTLHGVALDLTDIRALTEGALDSRPGHVHTGHMTTTSTTPARSPRHAASATYDVLYASPTVDGPHPQDLMTARVTVGGRVSVLDIPTVIAGRRGISPTDVTVVTTRMVTTR